MMLIPELALWEVLGLKCIIIIIDNIYWMHCVLGNQGKSNSFYAVLDHETFSSNDIDTLKKIQIYTVIYGLQSTL